MIICGGLWSLHGESNSLVLSENLLVNLRGVSAVEHNRECVDVSEFVTSHQKVDELPGLVDHASALDLVVQLESAGDMQHFCGNVHHEDHGAESNVLSDCLEHTHGGRVATNLPEAAYQVLFCGLAL